MHNMCNDPEQILEANRAGLISNEDLQKWIGLQGYKKELKKSKNSGAISESIFSEQAGKADAVYFQRTTPPEPFGFKLVGTDFEILDLKKGKSSRSNSFEEMKKSNETPQQKLKNSLAILAEAERILEKSKF